MTGAAQQAAAPEDDPQAVPEEKVTAEEDRNYNVYGKTEYSDDEEDDEDDDFDDDFLDDQRLSDFSLKATRLSDN